MKKLILIIAIAINITSVHAQHVIKDANGNYTVAKRDSVGTGKPTGHTITDKDGKTFLVYESKNGKLYYLRTSKAGNVYKSYIKE